ncbi:MAG: linear amide C-N hydrolase [Bacteroidales bacterium]|nr:linear amide C-N hydrolase [Candidatus Sodaliphilus aphodohippi]
MKKTIKFFTLIAFAALLPFLSCCDDDDFNTRSGGGSSEGGIFKTISHDDPVKVAPYLYEMTVKDYVFEPTALQVLGQYFRFGCASTRQGNYYGRNFDFLYNEWPEFIIHTEKTDKRFASVAVCHMMGVNDGLINMKYMPDLMFHLLEHCTMDGINENGVGVNVNIVPTFEPENEGTNPGKEKLYSGIIPRFILDNAKSAKHAIELLKERNITGTPGIDVHNTSFHFMIVDDKDTYVVEFHGNKMVVTETDLMTNFYIDDFIERGEIADNAMGVERYNILRENAAKGNTLEGMKEIMQLVNFKYTYDLNAVPLRKSDMSLSGVVNWRTPDDEVRSIMSERLADFEFKRNAGLKCWHTVHTSVYDIKNCTLNVCVQDDAEHWYTFGVNPNR